MRYVVLHHTAIAQPHFDLLLDPGDGGELLAWRLPRWPIEVGDWATPMPLHRRVYLDYEGDISGNRGRVQRVAAGDWTLIERRAMFWVIQLHDQPEHLTLRLLQDAQKRRRGPLGIPRRPGKEG